MNKTELVAAMADQAGLSKKVKERWQGTVSWFRYL